MRLFELPPELINEILTYNMPQSYAVSLWKCGNCIFNALLARSVQTIRLEDKMRDSVSRYPKMLSQLTNLRLLSIDRDQWRLGDPEYIIPDLMSLTTRLESLNLSCSDATNFLYQSDYSSMLEQVLSGADIFNVPLKSVSISEQPVEHGMWALGTFLPNLTSLTLDHGTASQTPHSFHPSDLLQLPRGLRTLRIRHNRALDDVQGILNLPRSLEVLVCRGVKASKWTREHSLALPPGLIELELSDEQPYQTLATIAALPRTLTRIQPVPALYQRDLTDSKVNPESLSQTEVIEAYYKALPPNLTRYRLPASPLNPLDTLGKMPESVTELDISLDRTDLLNGQDLTLLPKNILGLVLYRLDWTSVGPHSWPQNLLRLEIKEYRERELPDWSKLPRTLESLKWHATSRSQGLDPPVHRICDLPPNLKEIYMWTWGSIDVDSFELPKTLTHFSIFLVRLPRPISGLLPASLTHARLSTDSDWNDDDLAALPRSLKYLSCLSRSIPVTPDVFPRLPPSLTYLALNLAVKGTIEATHAAGLPRTLLQLELSCPYLWADSAAILALPPNITSLDASFPLTFLKYLPRSIHRLSLSGESYPNILTEEIIKIIPPNLRYLHVPECDAPETSVPLLPPSCEISLAKKKGAFWRHYTAAIQNRALESFPCRPDSRTFKKVNNLN